MEEHVLHATFTSRVPRLPVCLIRISGKMQSIKGGACPSRLCICGVLQCVAVCCSMLQCVSERCSVLQHVAVCGSVLQCVAVSSAADITTHCNTLQHTATHCNTPPRTHRAFWRKNLLTNSLVRTISDNFRVFGNCLMFGNCPIY